MTFGSSIIHDELISLAKKDRFLNLDKIQNNYLVLSVNKKMSVTDACYISKTINKILK